ncbi:MAG: tonB-dependent Receptor Plug domain protein [Sphingomonadales bacterium]|nr:tonB-dependent Receptor Plug domain protein [Sphingomonadales bacterium]
MLTAAAPAYAQQQIALNDALPAAGDNPSDSADQRSEIVVTGSHAGARAADKSLVPISVVSSEDLKLSGKQNLRDALAQAVPSYQLQTGGYQGQQGAAVRGARLRGLDAKDTLILVDGVRRHTTSLLVGGASPTDLDLIPSNAIDHIEVLGDGAASLYGSDAIAGVINIILKKSARTGGEIGVYYGQYGQTVGDLSHKYGRTKNVQFHQGFELGDSGGFINFSGNAQWQNATNNFPAFATPSLSDRTSLLYPILADGSLDPRETSKSRYRQWMGQPSSRTFSFAYNTEVPINPDLTFYSNATYAWRYSSGPGYFRSASNQANTPSTIPSTQDPFANAPYTSGALLFPDGYLPTFDVQENDFQVTAGVKGNIAGWDWNFNSGLGEDYAKVYTKNSNNTSAGPENWAQKDFYDGAQVGKQVLTTLATSKKLDSGFFGRPLSIALGIEHRYDSYTKKVGELLSYYAGPWVWPAGTGSNSGTHPNAGAQGMSGFTPDSTGSWSRNNVAAYVELNQQLTDAWTVDVAGRYEYFTDFGSAPSGQISTRYEFSPKFAVRGTFGNGFSAPTLLQSRNATQSGGFSRDTNPLSSTFGQIRQSQSVTTNHYQTIGEAIGVPALDPERSINASLGFVAKPFARTVLTVDGYLIDITNRITSATANVTAGSALAAVLSTAQVYNVTSVSFNVNGARTFTKGFDFRLEHTDTIGELGTLRWAITSNQNVTSIKSFAALPSVIGAASAQTLRVLTGALTSYYPKNITALALDWNYQKIGFRVKETRWSATNYLGSSPAADQHQSSAFTTDASISYALSDQINLSVGGNNVFNKRPDRLSVAASKLTNAGWNTDVPQYNYYAPFGLDGGFYYARVGLKW